MSDHSSGLWKLMLIPVAAFAIGVAVGAGGMAAILV